MNFRKNTLVGTKVQMYDAKTNETLKLPFESIAKAGRSCGIYDRSFTNIVKKRKTIDHPTLKVKVYFKEIN